MSVAQPQSPATARPTPERNEVKVISHSSLFYWWPVWAVGLLMALITRIDNVYMVTVPKETTVELDHVTKKVVDDKDKEAVVKKDAYLLPKKEGYTPPQPKVYMTPRKSIGVIFLTVLVLVILFTNVPLRGMWSYVVIGGIIMLSLIFHIFGVWPWIVEKMDQLDVRINLGGYLFFSVALFLIWLFTMIFFDRQIYMIFTPGQLKVCTEIGGGEKVYDAVGMTLEKHRSDLFRHVILGLGSGDLVVRTSGAQAHVFEMPNVLFIGQKVRQIEEMMKRKVVESN